MAPVEFGSPPFTNEPIRTGRLSACRMPLSPGRLSRERQPFDGRLFRIDAPGLFRFQDSPNAREVTPTPVTQVPQLRSGFAAALVSPGL